MLKVCGIFLVLIIITNAATNIGDPNTEDDLKNRDLFNERQNGFESPQSMEARPFQDKDCTKPVEEGLYSCRAKKPVYKWSNDEQKCVTAFYGGCNTTKNNFRTLEECQKTAEPVCKKN